MSQKFGEGYIEIKADNKAFMAGLSKTGSMFKGWASELGAAAGIIGFGAMLKGVTDLGDEMVKTSQKVGIGVESLQKMAYAAKLSDVDMGGLTTGLRMLSRNLVMGTEQTSRAFTALGLSGRQLASAGLDKALLAISDKFKEMPDGAAKAALAQELFGRGALQLIPLLNQGSVAIGEQMQELEDMGAVMSEQTARKAEELNDSLTRLGMVGRSLAITVGNELIPMLVDATKGMVAWWKANGEIIRQDIAKFFKGAAITGNALGRVITDLGTLTPKSFNLGGAAVRGFWTVLNMVGFELSRLGEATVLFYQMQISSVKKLFDLVLQLPPALQPEWLKNIASQAWTELDRFEKMAGEMGGKFQKMGNDFKLGMGTMVYASEHLAMSWGTGAEATREFSDELEKLLANLGKTGKEGKEAAKELMESWSMIFQMMGQFQGGGVPTSTMAEGGFLGGGESLAGARGVPSIAGTWGMSPMLEEQKQFLIQYGDELPDLINAIYGSLIPGDGMIQLAGEKWMELTDKITEEQNRLVESFSFMGMTLGEMQQTMGDLISGFFADSVSQGFGAGVKKLIGALINTFADFIIKQGMTAMGFGLYEVIMGSSPVMPRPDWVAHGGWAIAQGAGLIALGGALKGAGAAIGGMGGGAAAGSSFQANAARPTAGTVQPVNVNMGNAAPNGGGAGGGGGNTYIYAMDAASFRDFAERNSDTFADATLAAARQNHPIRQGL